jgi:hypothetical protein
MRPWAQWFVDHHLRWLLVIALPLHLLVGLWHGLAEGYVSMTWEFWNLMHQPRSKR